MICGFMILRIILSWYAVGAAIAERYWEKYPLGDILRNIGAGGGTCLMVSATPILHLQSSKRMQMPYVFSFI